MFFRGAPIHRDGHGKCGLLSPAFHHGLTPLSLLLRWLNSRVNRNPAWPCVIRQNPIDWSHGLWKKGLACVSCERVPYVMDGLGNRGRDHLTGRLVPVFYSDALCETSRPLAHR
jgi:hypothetical protein